MSAGLDNLKHIVVLMMENRSFDHMLRSLKTVDSRINSLTGKETNLDTTNEPSNVHRWLSSRANSIPIPTTVFGNYNLMLIRASFEHSIYKWPLGIGIALMIDEGKVAERGSDIDFSHLMHSYSAGLTLRAGGFPMVYLLFSWGGHEGTHTMGSMNTSLLGGGSRPALF